ncbi:MAG: hypothetical protein ABIS59_03375 [Candidatus Saccharibacteria bacterium]
MKIFIICSKTFYGHVSAIQAQLEQAGHTITLPNSIDNPNAEAQMREQGREVHSAWKRERFAETAAKVAAVDAVLVLNFENNGQTNYIGGATFLEVYDAFIAGKKIFFYNPLPDGMLYDELNGMDPILLENDLSKII